MQLSELVRTFWDYGHVRENTDSVIETQATTVRLRWQNLVASRNVTAIPRSIKSKATINNETT